MKHFFHLKFLMIGALLLAGFQVEAQEDKTDKEKETPKEDLVVHNYAPWEAGLFAGAANAYGDLVDTRLIQFNRTNLAYGGFIRYNASRNLSIRASYLRGKLEGSDMDSENLSQRGLSFESSINEIAVVGQWDFWGHKRYDDRGGFHRTLSPYAFAGFGVGLTDLTTDYSSIMGDPAMEEKAARDMQNSTNTQIAIPLGVGVNVDLSERLLFSFEFGFRPVFNDYLDGVSTIGNPNRNDWYSMAGTTLAYRITGQDKDRDGFPDHKDPCPTQWGSKQNLGCPDSDKDGIADRLDRCPEMEGPAATNGCPDRDKDGVPDDEDDCPGIPGSKATNGCADSDGDGILDSHDECPTIAGSAQFMGCRDTDKDGLPDSKDRCPYEKGDIESDGCPPPPDPNDPSVDSDGDGVPNIKDECPFMPGDPGLKGCRDVDKDGIADQHDRCPYEKGTPEHKGCPDPNDALTDTDGDGIANTEDKCPSIPGTAAFNGCRDSDGDGIGDGEDKCPDEDGLLKYEGCPTPDRDKDGFLDMEDLCPDKPGTIKGCPDTDGDGYADNDDRCPEIAGNAKGCPDSDADGLTDDIDDCPRVAGPKSRQGCPELTAADKQVLEAAVNNVSFNQGSYSLLSSSHQTLDRVAELMRRYPTYHLKIEGHTDNQGNAQANKQLSQLRAKACLDYLQGQGIANNRISYKGYGGEQPRATNDTQSGRRRNRRVEFELFDPNN
jgi:outer membrane protein OmpA-like peptidoglycan-associated protein